MLESFEARQPSNGEADLEMKAGNDTLNQRHPLSDSSSVYSGIETTSSTIDQAQLTTAPKKPLGILKQPSDSAFSWKSLYDLSDPNNPFEKIRPPSKRKRTHVTCLTYAPDTKTMETGNDMGSSYKTDVAFSGEESFEEQIDRKGSSRNCIYISVIACQTVLLVPLLVVFIYFMCTRSLHVGDPDMVLTPEP